MTVGWRSALVAVCTAVWLGGCATATPPSAQTVAGADASVEQRWSGRLGLQVEDAPSQSFSSSFELVGNAHAGSLSLTTPIGSTVALLRWAPGNATLQQGGKGETQRFASLGELAERATGTAIPVAALFDWLAGTPSPVPGWTVDLSAQPDGRITAIRQEPRPTATLRVVFER